MVKVEDEIREALERGEKEENVYSDVAREELVDSDEISAEEEGFMKGYDDDLDLEKEREDEHDTEEEP